MYFHGHIIFTCLPHGRRVNKIEVMDGGSRVNVKTKKVYVTCNRPYIASVFELF